MPRLVFRTPFILITVSVLINARSVKRAVKEHEFDSAEKVFEQAYRHILPLLSRRLFTSSSSPPAVTLFYPFVLIAGSSSEMSIIEVLNDNEPKLSRYSSSG